MAETQNMRRKSPRDTSNIIPGLAVLVACFKMVLCVCVCVWRVRMNGMSFDSIWKLARVRGGGAV